MKVLLSVRAPLLLAVIFVYVGGTSLNVVIQANQEECLFMTRNVGDAMLVELQVLSGAPVVQYKLLAPGRALVEQEKDMQYRQINETVHVPGDYAFCFFNTYHRDCVVSMEYDLHVDDQIFEELRKQVADEKKDYIDRLLQANQPRILPPEVNKDTFLAGAPKVEGGLHNKPFVYDNDTLGKVHDALLSLSLHADHISRLIATHTKRMHLHQFLQEDNASYVNKFSTALCFAIVLIGFVQIHVLKSFFNTSTKVAR